MTVWAVIVAAGSGDRFGGPKQYEPLGGRRVLDWSLGAARDGLRRRRRSSCTPTAPAIASRRPMPSSPAARPAASRCGPGSPRCPTTPTIVLVHDAARPFASADAVGAGDRRRASGADAVVPAVPVVDTLREVGGGTVDRSRFVAVQTPQGFRADVLRRAHAGGAEGTDDASLVEAIGGKVLVVDGEPENRKITTPPTSPRSRAAAGDRGSATASTCTAGRRPARPRSCSAACASTTQPGSTATATPTPSPTPAPTPLLGAAGLGDIGTHFPDTDERWRGADSVALLAEAARLVRDAGWEPGNVDCTVVLDAPKLGARPRRHAAAAVRRRRRAGDGQGQAQRGRRRPRSGGGGGRVGRRPGRPAASSE